jgi:hypothetical protein
MKIKKKMIEKGTLKGMIKFSKRVNKKWRLRKKWRLK